MIHLIIDQTNKQIIPKTPLKFGDIAIVEGIIRRLGEDPNEWVITQEMQITYTYPTYPNYPLYAGADGATGEVTLTTSKS